MGYIQRKLCDIAGKHYGRNWAKTMVYIRQNLLDILGKIMGYIL